MPIKIENISYDAAQRRSSASADIKDALRLIQPGQSFLMPTGLRNNISNYLRQIGRTDMSFTTRKVEAAEDGSDQCRFFCLNKKGA
jgi:hypothetical protein